MCYLLDAQGRQVGDNVAATRRRMAQGGDGIDRSHRPYYRLARDAKEAVLTPPYLSSATGNVCVTAAALRYAGVFPEISYEEGLSLMGPVRDPGANRPI